MHGLISRVDVIFSFQNKPPITIQSVTYFQLQGLKLSSLPLLACKREVSSQNWLGVEYSKEMGGFKFGDNVQTLCSIPGVVMRM